MEIESELSAEALAAVADSIFQYSPTPAPPILPSDESLKKGLCDIFHLQAFRPLQLDVIHAMIEGQDCFVRMPTGSGKSLLWQLPAVCQTGRFISLTVVICPTTSLIMDQMRRLCMMSPDFVAVCYHSDMPRKLKDFTLWLLRRPHIQPHCVLLTPDQLSNDPIKSVLVDLYRSGCVARVVIDEADKFLTWGPSFYPQYLNLKNIRTDFPTVPILAMTGSITIDDMDCCIEKLGMQNCAKFSDSLDRPNLYYEVKQKKNLHGLIKDIMHLTREGAGIVYCSFRKETTRLAAMLRNKGITAQEFHREMSATEKKQILGGWRRNEITVVVATTAFGMGIDKPNVRWVVHDTMPSSIEGWLQESGRAGRDGQPALSIIYFQVKDYYKVKKLIAEKSKSDLLSCLKPLHQLTEILLDNTSCRRQRLLNHFAENYVQQDCGACGFCKYACVIPWSRQNVTVDAQNALNLLGRMCKTDGNSHWTERHLAEAICGKTTDPKFKTYGVATLEGFGCGFPLANGQNATIPQIQEFILFLIQKGIIREYKREFEYIHYYIKPWYRAEDVAAMDLHMNLRDPDATPDELDHMATRMMTAHMHPDDQDMEFKVVREFNVGSQKMVDVIVID